MADYDLAIIGGGINGAGIARDAAGRGLRVLLVEQSDLASGTSSASTKLIHGGLRYLEHRAFRLVREALTEREVLLKLAPHVIRPMRFVLPVQPGMRSALVLRIGLWLYDHLGGRSILPGTRTADLTHEPVGIPLKRHFRVGFEYSDCWVDDSRLVVLNALDAAERGATIRTRTRCVSAERAADWTLVLASHGHRDTVTARTLVNAAGPWVTQVCDSVLRVRAPYPMRLVKGSHIVVRRLFEHDNAYIFQNRDGRVVFAIPFARDFTMIGTTDEDFRGDLAAPVPSREEIDYLCEAVSAALRRPFGPADVIWAFAGVRALHGSPAGKPEEVTRDYHLELDQAPGKAPLVTICGGKITTYRRLAEAALGRLGRFIDIKSNWTAQAPLPGGDFPHDGVAAQVARARQMWPFLTAEQASRLVQAYGTRIDRVLGKAASAGDLGEAFGAGLTAAEVRYLMRYEWAETPDDVLWRRTKLGLQLGAPARDALARFMAAETVAAEQEDIL